MVTYNHLNLPSMVFYPEDGRYILWVYTATGTKLQKYVCSTQPKAVWQSALNYANNNNSLQNADIQYGKRFAPLSTRRTAANQSLNTQQFYQYTRDSLNTILAQPLTNSSTGTYQEPQSLFDLVGILNSQANVTCYKHDYIGNIEYQNNQLEAYYSLLHRRRTHQPCRQQPPRVQSQRPPWQRPCMLYAQPQRTHQHRPQNPATNQLLLPIGNLSRTYPLSGTMALEQKYQYNGIELTNDFGLMINEARYRTLDPQLGRWWQIDPEVEQFYAWTPYNSNLGNPIRYEDKDGDTPITLGPAVAAGAVAFVVDVAFQVGANVHNGKPAFEGYSITSSLVSGAAAFGTVLTGGLLGAGAAPGTAVLIGAGTGGVFGAGESATKQYMETGKIDATKTITDGVVATVTAGYGEGGQQMCNMYTKGETITKVGEYAKDAVFNTVGEIMVNTGQGIADIERANKPPAQKPTTKTTTTSRPQQKSTPVGTKVGNVYVAPLLD